MAADYKIKRIYVCSPYRSERLGEVLENRGFARRACKFVTKQGKEYMPIAPHLLFPQFMDDDNPEERGTAINYGLNLIVMCDEVWVFGEKLSTGMATEISFAHLLINKKIRFFKEKEIGEFEEIEPQGGAL